MSPEVFVPLAEQAGLIEELTEHVLARSLAAVGPWRELRHRHRGRRSISARSAWSTRHFLASSPRSSSMERVPPHLLILEITEQSVIGDTPRTMRILERLDQIGVRISIDDFGTGHSSLTNLRRLPISELKVDRSFVTEMLVERNDEVIVRSTIDLGHNLGFTVVAEGVETAELVGRLQSLGCDVAQGFGVCRPLPFDKATRWLDRAVTERRPPRPTPTSCSTGTVRFTSADKRHELRPTPPRRDGNQDLVAAPEPGRHRRVVAGGRVHPRHLRPRHARPTGRRHGRRRRSRGELLSVRRMSVRSKAPRPIRTGSALDHGSTNLDGDAVRLLGQREEPPREAATSLVLLALLSALGGTRTPNLLIRRWIQGCDRCSPQVPDGALCEPCVGESGGAV